MASNTYDTIKDTNDSLVELLWKNMKDDVYFKANIIKNKKEIIQGSISDLNNTKGLFLYLFRIEPNPFLLNRRNAVLIENNGKYHIPPPLPLDLHYLVIPFTGSVEKDLILLGKVMQIFNDNSILANANLTGYLKDAGQDLRIIPEIMDIDEMNKLWSIFKDKDYRLCVSYMVTPVEITSTLKKDIDLVQEPPDIDIDDVEEGRLPRTGTI